MNDGICGFSFGSDLNLLDLFVSQIDIFAGRQNRQCSSFPDELFINTCFNRVVSQNKNGRDFIQKLEEVDEMKVARSTFFDAMHSQRRLDLIQNVASLNYDLLCKELYSMEVDYLHEFKELSGYNVLSTDGHYIEHSSHTQRGSKGKHYAAGNLYVLNLRNGLMQHLACVSDGSSKNHEMPIFKEKINSCNSVTKTIYVNDRAFIDYRWNEKQGKKGIHSISRTKSNSSILYCAENTFDKNDPVNAGVVSDKLGAFSSNGSLLRIIEYVDPETNEQMTFYTTLKDKKFRPGLICWLYFLRWRIEKVFDCFKNSLLEKKAWATGNIAIQIQGHFISLAYNFIQLLSEKTKKIGACDDVKSKKKYAKSLQAREERATLRGGFIHPLIYTSRRISRLSTQFIRSVRNYFLSGKPLKLILPVFVKRLIQYL